MGEASTRQADVIIHDSFPPEQIAVILVGSENPLTNLSIDTRDGLLNIIILRQGGLNTLRYQIVLHLFHPKHTKKHVLFRHSFGAASVTIIFDLKFHSGFLYFCQLSYLQNNRTNTLLFEIREPDTTEISCIYFQLYSENKTYFLSV